MIRSSHLAFGFIAELINTFPSVQGAADLLVSLNKALELNSQISILANENIAVVLQSIDFCLNISIGLLKGLVRETEVILFALAAVELLLGVAALALQFVQLSC